MYSHINIHTSYDVASITSRPETASRLAGERRTDAAGGARDVVTSINTTTRAISRDTAPTTHTLTSTTPFRPSQHTAKMSEYIG